MEICMQHKEDDNKSPVILDINVSVLLLDLSSLFFVHKYYIV